MEKILTNCTVRSFTMDDAESIARYANNRKIWRNLRDAFPHPYSLADAEEFLTMVLSISPETIFCIEHQGEAIGAIGFTIQSDVNRISAEIGYWIGEPFWGQGVAAEALRFVTEYAMERHHLKRIYAMPFAWNPASCRVLEKAGYTLESRQRQAAVKDGEIIDQFLYVYLADSNKEDVS